MRSTPLLAAAIGPRSVATALTSPPTYWMGFWTRGSRASRAGKTESAAPGAGDVVAGLEKFRHHLAEAIGTEARLQLAEQGRELLGPGRAGVVAFELRDGLFRKVERVELIELGAKESCFVFGKTFGRSGFGGFAEQIISQTPASAVGRQRGGQARV